MTEPLVLLPPASALATAFLREQPEMIALVVDRVVTELGKNQLYPAIRITQFNDAPSIPRPLVHTAAEMQVDAFGGPKALALQIAETARALFVARFMGLQSFDVDTHPISGLVTGCTVSGLADRPDVEFAPAKPRWLFRLTAYVRAPRAT